MADFQNRIPAVMKAKTEAEIIKRVAILTVAIQRPIDAINFTQGKDGQWRFFFYLRLPLHALLKENGGKI